MRRSVGRDRTRKLTQYLMRLAAIILVLIHALFTWGCASVPATTEVKVPLAVACVRADQIPAKPATKADADILKMDRRKRTLTVWDERAQLRADDEHVRALLQACAGGK